MKKRIWLYLLVLFVFIFSSNIILAKDIVEIKKNIYPANILNLYKTGDKYPSVGIKHHLEKGIYLGGNLEYQQSDGAELELSSVYMIPDVFIFDFYGGGGLKVNIKNKDLDPYLLLGNQFIFLFSEVKYYLSEDQVESRAGFKFKF
ncbi:hypothetical protein Halha_2577 [Halobacteroides halobius DSM 5150]|uniref:Outer membrane protein beta-barrel domain-containing protein n=1 Tax=Halobacteroides halobius (strain ATCC 35273 / DSM 5150 / MD-1) TaxID=748449 RepID=L0KBR7_HALHC|nr:hypothetical protein [Halobacteroides halobius]AGB42451.1 hypothetical protein Halha_2577 [Halobacteroides halobius DSM 5150]